MICLLGWSASASAVTITSFTPTRGAPDTMVRINGTGFGTSAEDVVVSFNGGQASISTMTATRLNVSVPYEAISGPITVTVNGQTATSSGIFRAEPRIESFSPGGVVGDSVTIRGVNFGETPAANQVKFNGVTATVVSASATELVVTVPAGVTTGPITVDAYSYSVVSWANFVVTVPQTTTSSELIYAGPGEYQDSGGVLVIDTGSGQPIAAIATGRIPRELIANPSGTRVYVINEGDSSVSVIDTATHTVLATVATGINPKSLHLDTSGSFLYVLCGYHVTVIDLATNTVTASIDPGIGVAYGFTYSSVRDTAANRLYVVYYRSGGATTLHFARIDMATGALIDSRPMVGMENLNFVQDPASGHLYFAEYAQVKLFDASAFSVIKTYFVDSGLSSVSTILGIDGDPLYVLGDQTYPNRKLYALDPATGSQRWNLQLPDYAGHVLLGPGESEAYVSASGGELSVIDLHEQLVLSTSTIPDDRLGSMMTNTGGDHLITVNSLGTLSILDRQDWSVLGTSLLSGPGRLLVVNTVPADRLGVARRQHEAVFADAYVDVPFEVIVQAHHAGGAANVVTPTAVGVALAPGTLGTLSGGSGCTIPAGRSYCLARGLVIDTRQSAAQLVLTATSGDVLTSVTSPPFAVIGTVDPIITSLDPDRGPVGATVRIIGSDLKQDSAIVPEVYFNGIAAVVTSSTDDEIVATVPAGATSGPVTVHVSESTAESPGDFTVLPVPSIIISNVDPPVALSGSFYTATVTLTKPFPADPAPTGTVTVTDLTNQVSCTFTLPQSGCRLFAPHSSPNSVLLSAAYMGDAAYGEVSSATFQHRIAYNKAVIEIGNMVPETAQAGQGSFVFFTIANVSGNSSTSLPPIGYVRITDGVNNCSYGNQFTELSGGGCALGSPTAGTRTIRAYFPGDYNYATAWSEPVTQSVSSPGGAVPLPPGTELCGFDPDADYPPQAGFVPVAQLSGGVPSLGLERSINGSGPVGVEVTSPMAASTVNGRSVDVAGTFQGPVNTGITVNGVVAATANGQFLAVAVPVEIGTNTLEVVATTMTGSTATASVTIQGSADPAPLAIEAVDLVGQVGFGPFQAVYRMDLDHLPSGVTVSNIGLDLNGDGLAEYRGATLDGAPNAYTFPRPGLYRARVDINHSEIVAYRYILVRDRVAQRSMLCDIYGYLRGRLAAQDVIGAADAFHPDHRTEYLDLFTSTGTQMPELAQRLGTVADGQFSGDVADLMLIRDQPDETRTGYPLRLMQGADGVWRILEM
ncbi:MAG TPA: IPT/TIG domain-containing protein [Dokdonella sp.]|uniref:IPT/TIG domain-containing protein n=1 Tax=Dokdonella sp. TaxID=2291710 RepID=UPI002C77AAB4|nr:IPT/TIG domain-containing protein [Dokdonella sp.]HUD40572.1 IPT/TIG domain-containing protein [Dokdonella sp.]